MEGLATDTWLVATRRSRWLLSQLLLGQEMPVDWLLADKALNFLGAELPVVFLIVCLTCPFSLVAMLAKFVDRSDNAELWRLFEQRAESRSSGLSEVQ